MKLKLDFLNCWLRDIEISLCLMMALVLIIFCSFFFSQHVITRISSRVPLIERLYLTLCCAETIYICLYVYMFMLIHFIQLPKKDGGFGATHIRHTDSAQKFHFTGCFLYQNHCTNIWKLLFHQNKCTKTRLTLLTLKNRKICWNFIVMSPQKWDKF